MSWTGNEEGALSYLLLSRMDIGLLLQLPNRGFLPQHLGLLLGSATSCTLVRLTLLNVITIQLRTKDKIVSSDLVKKAWGGGDGPDKLVG